MNCKHCKKGSIKDNQRFNNLDGTMFCMDCYKEVAEYTKKGAFSDLEYDEYLGKYIELKTAFSTLMLSLKRKCLDDGLVKSKDYMGLLNSLIEAEKEYCLEELSKDRKTISFDDFIVMAFRMSASFPDSVTPIHNNKFGLEMENVYTKGMSLYPLLQSKQV